MVGHTQDGIHLVRKTKIKSTKFKTFVDKFIFIIVLVGPILTLPQVFKIWYYQNAASISLISFTAYIFTNTFWLAYGLFHKEKPIILSSCLWLLLNILIVIGTILYG